MKLKEIRDDDVYPEAIRLLQEALGLNPLNLFSAVRLSKMLHRTGETCSALRILDKHLVQAPKNRRFLENNLSFMSEGKR